jgi:CRISPR-associated protein Csb2
MDSIPSRYRPLSRLKMHPAIDAPVAPVILPGPDDHTPGKTRRPIEKALRRSGIDQPCEFNWSAFSQFRKMLPVHKYRKDRTDPSKKILINYFSPNPLLQRSAAHPTIRFTRAVPGPLTIGAGRHGRLGAMAAVD